MARRFGTKQKPEHAGEVRQSQLITTFGVGSIVDFVKDTVMIAGVDDWDRKDGWEERKLFNNNLEAVTGVDYFLSPKTKTSTGMIYIKSHDVESRIFPQKLYCPMCNHIIDAKELSTQKLKHNCFMPSTRKENKPCGGRLVASRFVIICPKGHIEDFPYSWWVHNGKHSCEKSKNPRIKMYNIDNRSDIDSLYIECVECKARRRIAPAFSRSAFAGENGYECRGKHPHLGSDFTSECSEIMIARVRSSTSVYFSATLSALTIPPWSRKAVQEIEKEYEALIFQEQYGINAVEGYIRLNIIKAKKVDIDLSDLMAAFALIKDQKNSDCIQSEADILAAEYSVFCRGTSDDDDFVASSAKVPLGFTNIFDAITVVDKLSVINALVGFTRVDPWDGALQDNEQLAPLAREKKDWLPAVKLLGEGIFFQFNQDTLTAWERTIGDKYQEMYSEFMESFLSDSNARFALNDRFSPQYIALHSFAHLLIRQLSKDCGYSVSSIKEKIYSTYMDEPNRPAMCGVLIYLSTSDSEGSLGGLISIANDHKRMESVLKNMLYKALWCSADPLCCESKQQGFHSLNYAACHDCALLPETSCEFRNVLLDRISIVGMPGEPKAGLMSDIAASLLKSEMR